MFNPIQHGREGHGHIRTDLKFKIMVNSVLQSANTFNVFSFHYGTKKLEYFIRGHFFIMRSILKQADQAFSK